MRTFLISSMAMTALVLSGCAAQDPNSVPTVTPADTSTKPGSGPGAPPSTGVPGNTGPHFIE